MTHQWDQLAVMFACLGEADMLVHTAREVRTNQRQHVAAKKAKKPTTPEYDRIPLSLPELV